jgi:hypothetical protein
MTLSPQIRLRLGATLLAVAAAGCSSEGPNPPGPEPAAIAMAAGDNQSAPAGTALPELLVVRVTDDAGNPAAGVTVQWAAQGGGSVSAAVVATGEDGRSAVQRFLGSAPGEQATTAAVSELSGSPVRFTATAEVATGPRLTLSTQPSTTATSGVPLAQQPVLQLVDPGGAPLAEAGVDVTAAPAGAGVTVGGTLTRATDDQGRAVFTGLSLSGPAGSYALRFTASGYTEVISEPVTLAAGGSQTLAVLTQPPTSALMGEVWIPAAQPVVRLLDGAGAPVAGVEVTASIASGSGTLEGVVTATTNAEGSALFLDLGIAGTGPHTLRFTAGAATVTGNATNLTALPPEAATGKWDPPVNWDIVPLHMNMLPNGKLIAWGKFETGGALMGQPRLWDPSAGGPASAPTVANDTMLFCAGHALMADGNLMVSGGHKADDRGLDVTNIFDYIPELWRTGLPKMAKGRWYPTVTTLPDGRLVTVAGKDTTKTVVGIPEVWEGGRWVQLPGANLKLPYYPRNFVAPDGRVFYAGEQPLSRWLDVDGSTNGQRGRWTAGPSHIWPNNRDYGSAVMYDAGKIMVVGGGGDPGWDSEQAPKSAVPTATAEKIDLNGGSPSWLSAGSMSIRRRHLNATVLPDGTVLVTGGISGGGGLNNLEGTGVHEAEVWDPATNQWTTLASNTITRAYHSVSLLMVDGTVLSGASGDAFVPGTNTPYPPQRNHEIFHPPYLFKGARPTIADAPPTVGYGNTFTITTPNAAQIEEVRWIRLASVTHAFDANARANQLAFTASASGVQVEAPSSRNLAPPGHYVLYILNRNGVPSTGQIIQIQ